MRRRVLVLVAEAYGCGGGIAQFNRNLLDGLCRRDDLEVRAHALYGSVGAGEPAELRWIAPVAGGRPGFALAALATALRWRPQLVICGLVGLGGLSVIAARASGARLWSVVHGWEVWAPGPWYDNAGLERSDLISAVSHFTRGRLLSWCRVPPSRVQLLPNAVDLKRFSPGPRPRDLEQRYDVGDAKVLLTVGRLDARDRYKGHDRVIALLANIRERVGAVRYLIAGEGDDRARLELLALDSGVGDLVTFLGEVDEHQLRGLYQLADVFVMPSTGEGFGIVFLEAMASGCPVIGGNRDGAVDALAGGELGVLVDPNDAGALQAAIEKLLLEGRSHTLPIRGVERFSLARFSEQLGGLVDRILGPELFGP